MNCTNFTNRNRTIDQYFSEIKKCESLTKEKEIELFTRVSNGDSRATDEIFASMAKLAVAVAKTYTSNPELLEDIIQEANFGILKAIPKFDITKGYRFSSYARWWMKAEIGLFLDQMSVIQRKNTALADKVKRIRQDFFKEEGRDATEYEVLDILEAKGEVVNDMGYLYDLCIQRIDLNVGDEDGDTACEVGEFATATAWRNDFESEMDIEEKDEKIGEMMKVLDEREKRMVTMKYGLYGVPQMEYDVIAEREMEITGKKITSERVRQIVVGAEKKMQANS